MQLVTRYRLRSTHDTAQLRARDEGVPCFELVMYVNDGIHNNNVDRGKWQTAIGSRKYEKIPKIYVEEKYELVFKGAAFLLQNLFHSFLFHFFDLRCICVAPKRDTKIGSFVRTKTPAVLTISMDW